MRLWGCVHRLDFIRNVLLEGLVEAIRLGVNPYQLGMIGSTDTHNGIPGHVATQNFHGHIGIVDDTAEERLAEGNVTHDGYINNPGGLAGVWAVENSRDAIFDAIQNRSTFATSGPRIKPRFYAGWDFQDDLCDDTNRVRIAGTSGVSMGQVLRPKPGAMPRFMVQADADNGGLKAGLQRIQIIKGWVDEKGKTHHAIYDVAGDGKAGADLTPKNCDSGDAGFRQLCGVWSDPKFDANQHAFYYARVLEVPTCRWSTLQCQQLPDPNANPQCGMMADEMVQQRAWTSPIWYTPAKR